MRKLCFFASLGLLTLIFPPSSFGLSADSLRVQALNNQAGAATLYSLDFTLQDTLYPDGVIEVAFPAEFDLSKVELAGSRTINGGFTVEVDRQTVYIKRKGRGAPVMPGTKVDIKLSLVKNPKLAESSHVIKLKVARSKRQAVLGEWLGSLSISGKKSVKSK